VVRIRAELNRFGSDGVSDFKSSVGGELTVESLVGKGLPVVVGVDLRDPSLRSG